MDVNQDPRVTLNTGISVSQSHPDRVREVLPILENFLNSVKVSNDHESFRF